MDIKTKKIDEIESFLKKLLSKLNHRLEKNTESINMR